MSLNWDVGEVRNHKAVTTQIDSQGNEKWHPVTEALIWHTMYTGMNRITEENWEEFFNRVQLWEKGLSPSLSYLNEDGNVTQRYITALDVYTHIGLWTNASSKTKAQFLKSLYENAERENGLERKRAAELYEEQGLETISVEDFQNHFKQTKEAA